MGLDGTTIYITKSNKELDSMVQSTLPLDLARRVEVCFIERRIALFCQAVKWTVLG